MLPKCYSMCFHSRYTAAMKFKISFLIVLPYLIFGCASQHEGKSEYPLFDQIKLSNQSRFVVEQVQIYVPANRGTVICDQLSPGGFCANRFKARRYQGNPAEISWVIAGKRRQKLITREDIALPVEGEIISVELVLNHTGNAEIKVVSR